MRIRSFNSNLIDAIDNDTSVPDRNLPVYVSNYQVRVASATVDLVDVVWSTVGFVPSYEIAQRVFHLRLCATFQRSSSIGAAVDITFVFDFSALGRQFMDRWNISLRGPLEGYLTEGAFIRCLSAYRRVSYEYDASTYQLLLYVRDLPSIGTPSSDDRIPLFIDLSIKDDVNDPDYPSAYPREVADQVMNIPMDTPYTGDGIRVVIPIFVCCPDELKALQLSSLDPELEGAFNPIPEISYFLNLQGVPVPASFDIEYIDAEANPLQPDDPVNWKQNLSMRGTAYVMEMLFSIVPHVSIIILYSLTGNVQQPSYMTWLAANVARYDIVLHTQNLLKDTPWQQGPFNATVQFYDTVLRTLADNRRPFVATTGNDGTETNLQFPSRLYDFSLASSYSIGVGSFELRRRQGTKDYNLRGPYQASTLSSGGYSNQVQRPSYQYGVNYRNLYGRPDVAGYFGYYFAVIDEPVVEEVLGTQLGTALLVALFVMIMQRTQRKEWDFKFILYRKALTTVQPIYQGQNIGTEPDNRYNARNYPYWNPISGLGNVGGQYWLDMCDVIRNFQVIQISTAKEMDHPLAFVNAMPPNPFGNLITRQPVMGCSSIFSLFRIQRVSGSGDPTPNDEPIHGSDQVYFVDVTQRFALAAAIDDNGKWYVVLSTLNYGSSAQKWILTLATNPSSRDPIYAFDEINIAPSLQPLYSLSTKWNAMGATVPSSPSISDDIDVVEAFVLCTDPASTSFLDEIMQFLTDDLMTYSYYVNLSTFARDVEDTRGDTVFLNNPDLLSLDSDTDEIHVARNRAHNDDVQPRWAYGLDPYPQWILVPVPCSFSNPLNVPYTPEMVQGGQYMIFNTVLQAYVYIPTIIVPPTSGPPVYLRPLSSDTASTIPFYAYVFTVTDAIQILSRTPDGKIFRGTDPLVMPVPIPPTVRIDPFEAQLIIYNFWMNTEIARDGVFVANGLLEANMEEGQQNSLRTEQMQGDTVFADIISLYWVFKRYIATRTTPTRFIVYNDIADALPANAGLTLCAEGSPTNVDTHAPSLLPEPIIADPAFFWFNITDSNVVDINFPISPGTTYGIIHEGLSREDTDATQWQVLSLLRNDTNPDAVFALGVYGNGPQPRMLEYPFPQAPDAIRWNTSTSNQFFTPPYGQYPGPVQRSNYLYMNTVYAMYTMNPIGAAGFLSSVRTNGVAPSLYGNGYQPVMTGNTNTLFLLVSPYPEPPFPV